MCKLHIESHLCRITLSEQIELILHIHLGEGKLLGFVQVGYFWGLSRKTLLEVVLVHFVLSLLAFGLGHHKAI